MDQEKQKEMAEKETQDVIPKEDLPTESVTEGGGEVEAAVMVDLLEKPASLSPTHSIEEDYKKMNMTKMKKKDEDDPEHTADSPWDELKGQVYDAADTVKASLGSAVDDLTKTVEESLGTHKEKETPGEKAMKEYESIDVSATAVEDAAEVAGLPDETKKKDEDSKPNIQLEKEEKVKPKNQKQQQRFPSIEAPSLESVIKAAQSFLPQPPPEPPTQQNIDNNHNTTNENLSEINSQLQHTLTNQRKDLGKLRKKINELEQELQRAKRTKRKDVEQELETKTRALREEYDEQLIKAKETIAALEKQSTTMEQELQRGKIKLEEALEDKERVAAEYSYVVNSYQKLKGMVDSQTSDLSTKLDQSQQEIMSLEGQLTNATTKMEQYQKESNNWRKECTNKANQLDTFTTRVQNLQSTIDTLQDGINSTQTSIDQIKKMARDEERMRSKMNLQTLSDEYEVLLSKKSKKIGELRVALRSANAKKRHAERYADKEKRAAIKVVREELNVEIEGLKEQLKTREEEIEGMRDVVREAESVKEEKEQLLAEIM